MHHYHASLRLLCSLWLIAAPGAVLMAANTPNATLTPDLSAQLSQNVNRPVIVIMKNALTGDDAASDQAPVLSELKQVRAARVKSYRMVNSLAATVSDAELQRLKANPAVAEVVPDVTIRRPVHASAAAASSASPNVGTSLPLHVIPGACAPFGLPSLEPEALQTTNTDSLFPGAPTARSLGYTGAGVKVAWIADGVDPMNVNFIRPNGTSAFFDYQDFSGDGPGQATSGDEAFLDSNAIGGQGIQVYNANGFSAQPDPGACNIRIEGVAPGAAMLGLDVFGSFEYTTQSNFLEAIEYAVTVDHVDVINESFGRNPYPDISSQDATKLFNDAAVRAGVVVTVSSGDAGSTNTIGSPATDPLVIAVGASTTFRYYAQTNYAAARYFATTGWLDDNISSLSSGGFSETGATLDLVAPGDDTWASCDASAEFAGCINLQNASSDIEASGGTSLSSPLTAGAAALVIEAYRTTHHGASPSPALVKQILTSTATDLGVPATEQGAGQINTYRAVLLAESINGGRAGRQGETALMSLNQLNAVGTPGSRASWPVSITNTGAQGQVFQVSGRTFGPSQNVQSGSVSLVDGVSPEFDNFAGVQNNYGVFHFFVPGGVDRLSAAIAYPGNPANGLNARVRMILVDPAGRFAAHSLPQGVGNFGSVDVREPVGGVWTGVIFGDVASADGTNGAVPWQVSTQSFAPFGTVTPSSFYLAPGQSQTVTVAASTPSSPGDAAGSIVVSASGDGLDSYVGAEHNSIPVTLRSLIDLSHGGSFSGVLTGGNGRDPGEGQIAYYQFNVGAGHENLTADLALSNDAADPVALYLINPDGVAVAFGQNQATAASGLTMSATTLEPIAGTWTLIAAFAEPVVGDEIAQHFSGNVTLDSNQVSVSAPGLPQSQRVRLAAGTPVTIPVRVTNHSIAPEAFFIDARLDSTGELSLASAFGLPAGYVYTLPLGSVSAVFPAWLVPSHTSSLAAIANASVPIEFDLEAGTGEPDLLGAPSAPNTAAVTYTPAGGVVEAGDWESFPTELGPYPPGGATPAPMTMTLTATTMAFDPAVTSATGDLWLLSTNPTASVVPVILNPGQTTVIPVTITPAGPHGSVVNGTLYVDDAFAEVGIYEQTTGDDLAAIPYSYTIE
jgi:hypothetical protein